MAPDGSDSGEAPRESHRMTEWITDRRPLPVDANDNDDVKVQLSPKSTVLAYMHRVNVGLGTPWRHCHGWRFPDISIGQVWRCEDGRVRVVKHGDSNGSWLIGDYWYTSDGEAPGVPGALTSVRLAELISDPKASQIPPAILSGAEAFYVLVADKDTWDGQDWWREPVVLQTPILNSSSLQAALNRQAMAGSRYGTTYVAQCRIVPSLTATPPNSEAS
jgi:hypothetical protein